jgi:flavin-dependent dehydrogenase
MSRNPLSGYDVVVLGGGPAGCATALSLALRGIDRILVVESSRYEGSRIGETIPPDTRVVLEQLGVWDDFVSEPHEPCLGSCSSWGDDQLGYNDFLFNPFGNGWHLDRRRFDSFLAKKTGERGAEVRTGTMFVSAGRIGSEGFRLRLAGDDGQTNTVTARFVVDATGMSSGFARQMGAKTFFLDRLICVAAFFELTNSSSFSQLTMLEAVEYGWWYAAKLPNGRVTVALASDPELIRRTGLNQEDAWLARLGETNHVSRVVADCALIEDSLRVCNAPSLLLDRTVGNGWLAVGDAASTYDPISSQGIYKALANGVQAAEVIAAFLDGKVEILSDYQSSVARRFEDYLANRNFFYGVEQRWSASPFWSRRQQRTAL